MPYYLKKKEVLFNCLQYEEVDIIGYNRVSARPDGDLKTLARNTLHDALDDEAYGQTGDRHVYGNTLGVELIKERDDIRSKADTLVTQVKELKTKVKELEESKEREVLELQN